MMLITLPPIGTCASAGAAKIRESKRAAPSMRVRISSVYTEDMVLKRYLPSAQFAVMAGSLALSGGFVIAAQYVTRPQTPTLATTVGADQPQTQRDWEVALAQVEAQSGVSAPQAPDQSQVGQLLASAQSSNRTDSIARSLLVSITNAKAQGLGDDIPTQDEIVSQVEALTATSTPQAYTAADFTVVPTTQSSLRAYGNGFIKAVESHPDAN